MDIAASQYGADEAGLICGFACGAGAEAEELNSAQAAEWLALRKGRPDAGPGAFLWLHFNVGHTGTLRWLSHHAGLPQAFYDTVKDGIHSTRLEREEDTLIAVINDVNFDFSFDASDTSTLWISVSRHLVVTARLRPLRSVDQLRATLKRGERLRSAAELLAHLLRNQANALVDIVRQVTSKVDSIEDDLLSHKLDHKRVRLGALRRLLVRLQRLLAPEPAALFRLLQYPPAWMDDTDVQDLRQASEEFSVVLRDMSSLQERIKLLQEEIAARVNEDNGRSLFVLTIVTVLALPINLTAGLFGMNVGGIPLSQHAHGFWIIVAFVASITGLAGWLAFRSRRDDR